MSISENIKRLREAYGLTQDELGEIAGVSGKAVSKWESGASDPRMGAVQRIADHFNISKSAIVDEYDMADERQVLLEKAFSDRPEMRMLFSIADKATPEDIEKTIRILEALRGE